MEKINNCPACGSKRLDIVEHTDYTHYNCKKCGAEITTDNIEKEVKKI